MIAIRREQPGDLSSIREVNASAFGQPQEADIVDALRSNCTDVLSLVAVRDGPVVGHILFSPATIDAGDRAVSGMGLAPMAVLPECQRQGIGSALVEEGLARLKRAGCPFVIVVGHPAYYPRFGFEPASRHGMRCEWDVPDDAFMICILDPAVMQGISGLAKYRPEFAAAL